jgi:hypothetical protein
MSSFLTAGSPLDSCLQWAAISYGMAHLSETDRSQLLLLPEAGEDYVGSDIPVRFIEAFALFLPPTRPVWSGNSGG